MFRTYIYKNGRCQVTTPDGDVYDCDSLTDAHNYIREQKGKPKQKM